MALACAVTWRLSCANTTDEPERSLLTNSMTPLMSKNMMMAATSRCCRPSALRQSRRVGIIYLLDYEKIWKNFLLSYTKRSRKARKDGLMFFLGNFIIPALHHANLKRKKTMYSQDW
jgi:hypothetical protein